MRFPLFLLLVLVACARLAYDTVEATGTLEVVEVDVAQTTAGRVARMPVNEGDTVRAGDTLAVLTMPALAADVAQREAKAASAGALLQDAERGPPAPEIASAAAHRDALRSQLKLLREGTRSERVHAAAEDAKGARVYVSDAVLSRVRPGQTVHARLDAYPDRAFAGHVVALSTQAEFTPRVALTEKERADLLFGVKIEFADSTSTPPPP